METFFIVVLLVLCFILIEEYPSSLSKRIYYKKVHELLEQGKKRREALNDTVDEKVYKLCQFVVKSFFLCIELLLLVFYYNLGKYIDNDLFFLLSLMQMLTVLIHISRGIRRDALNATIDDFKFRRGYSYFNLMLDTTYLPLAFYFLCFS